VLAYYFPPLGGAGVQRTTKLLKHLPSLGWDTVVVTGPEGDGVPWAPHDATLAHDVPESTAVVRIQAAPPVAGRAEARWRRLTGSPTRFDRWWQDEASRAAFGVPRDVDLVYASMSPFSTAAAAQAVARERGIPWVADLRDPWALDEWASYPSALQRSIDRRRMRRALGAADAIVMNTEEARAALLRTMPEIEEERVSTVPNGWDEEDFAGPPPARDDDAFRIVLTGHSHVARRDGSRLSRAAKVVLGGITRGIRPAARSHAVLLEAIRDLAAADPRLVERLEVHVAGPASPEGVDGAGGGRVVHHGYLAHAEAISLLRSADLLFLPMHGLPPGVRATTVPGKTYEYLAACRPILAALPEGDARDLVTELPDAWTCRPTDVKCLTSGLRALIALGRHRRIAPPPFLGGYERRALAERLVTVFDRLVPQARLSTETGPAVRTRLRDARERA